MRPIFEFWVSSVSAILLSAQRRMRRAHSYAIRWDATSAYSACNNEKGNRYDNWARISNSYCKAIRSEQTWIYRSGCKKNSKIWGKKCSCSLFSCSFSGHLSRKFLRASHYSRSRLNSPHKWNSNSWMKYRFCPQTCPGWERLRRNEDIILFHRFFSRQHFYHFSSLKKCFFLKIFRLELNPSLNSFQWHALLEYSRS